MTSLIPFHSRIEIPITSQTRKKNSPRKRKKKRKRKELHITTLSQSLLTTASRTRYHVSAKSRVSPSREKKKSGNVGGKKGKKEKKGKKKEGEKKCQSGAHRVCVCVHTPGRKLAVPVFTILNSGESVAGRLCVSAARDDAFSLQRKPRCTRCRVTFNWVICPGTPSIRAVIGLI